MNLRKPGGFFLVLGTTLAAHGQFVGSNFGQAIAPLFLGADIRAVHEISSASQPAAFGVVAAALLGSLLFRPLRTKRRVSRARLHWPAPLGRS